MTEIANFKIEQFGAEVATISENEEQVVEVQRHSDGALSFIVHRRRCESDLWDDLTVKLTKRDFAVLGSIATMGANCTCGAPDTGRWANKHTAGCANLNNQN